MTNPKLLLQWLVSYPGVLVSARDDRAAGALSSARERGPHGSTILFPKGAVQLGNRKSSQ